MKICWKFKDETYNTYATIQNEDEKFILIDNAYYTSGLVSLNKVCINKRFINRLLKWCHE